MARCAGGHHGRVRWREDDVLDVTGPDREFGAFGQRIPYADAARARPGNVQRRIGRSNVAQSRRAEEAESDVTQHGAAVGGGRVAVAGAPADARAEPERRGRQRGRSGRRARSELLGCQTRAANLRRRDGTGRRRHADDMYDLRR